jgi:hypothetical protein
VAQDFQTCLQRRIDDLDKRLDNEQLKVQERHEPKDERRRLVRSLIHYYGYLLKGAA